MKKRSALSSIKHKIHRFLAYRRVYNLFTSNLKNNRNIHINKYIEELYEEKQLMGLILFAFDWTMSQTIVRNGIHYRTIVWSNIDEEYRKFYRETILPIIESIDDETNSTTT